MNWNVMCEDDRIHLWRMLRKSMKSLPTDKKIQKVVEFAATIPYTARTIDYYSPSTWPAPWEILHNALFCANGISILLYHTLKLSEIQDIELLLVNYAGDIFLLPCVDGIHVLNFSIGEVCSLTDLEKNDKFQILNVFDDTVIKQVV
jgi:hypothetical protein